VLAIRTGEVRLRLGSPREAARIAEDVLTAEPDHFGALELLAKAQWQAGEHPAMLTTLKRLVAINPYEPGYHYLRGVVMQATGRYGEAAQSFARASALPEARQALEELRSWQGEVVAGLLRDDPVFRAQYIRDAELACAQRGFDFVSGLQSPNSWVPDLRETPVLYARPS